ncbi:hypothetical protein [Lishizhenia sp.]|uniref:hypothetical protein n=1 Tax=Lishizhenia sp. TaxID=2497594 RepID=UPI00299DFE95|nr:hypothetical protein [Lishizhenia sp.]MDX1445602.1 hypothetical protein [Lishizhenia sp.]
MQKVVVLYCLLSFSFLCAQVEQGEYFGKSNFIGFGYSPWLGGRTYAVFYEGGEVYKEVKRLTPHLNQFEFRYYKTTSNRMKFGFGFAQRSVKLAYGRYYPDAHMYNNSLFDEHLYEYNLSGFIPARAEIKRRRYSFVWEYTGKQWAALPFANFTNVLEVGFEKARVQAQESPVYIKYQTMNYPQAPKYDEYLSNFSATIPYGFNFTSVFVRVGVMNSIPLNKMGILRWGGDLCLNIVAKSNIDPEFQSLTRKFKESVIREFYRIRVEYVFPIF